MLKLLAILIFTNTVASWESEVCCCGCESPCEITLKDSCGAPPTTPCIMKSNFNKEELLSPCSMVLKLHKYEISGVKPIETDYNAVTTAPAQSGDSSSHYRYGQVIPGKKTFESSQIKFSGSESHQYIPIPRKVDKESVFPFSLPNLSLDKIFSSSSASGGELISDKHVVEGGIPMREIIRRLPDGGISVMKFNDDGTNKSVAQLESESRTNTSKFTSELQQQIPQAMSQVKDTFDKMFSVRQT
ncbi:hypothetical protein WR25_22604 [Diploscapter pachys]|uniref:Uncharacterized protein n=1 Tax=Diploscapter pachys TaxID=2018661 RepID=A0A2A2JP68_9BILA|nr:hypothetical protein WR25_22604 [Diploscapter pachys]